MMITHCKMRKLCIQVDFTIWWLVLQHMVNKIIKALRGAMTFILLQYLKQLKKKNISKTFKYFLSLSEKLCNTLNNQYY